MAGWDGFFVWDHLVRPAPCPVTDPWEVLAAIAATTQRIRFGPMVSAPRWLEHCYPGRSSIDGVRALILDGPPGQT